MRRALLAAALAMMATGPARAGDANYMLAFFSPLPTAGIKPVTTVVLLKDHSPCITLVNDTKFDTPYPIAPGQTKYIAFYRSGDCHGRQGYLGVRFSGGDLPPVGADDFQQFWFDAAGGFEKRDPQSAIPNRLTSYGRRMDDTVFLRDVIGEP